MRFTPVLALLPLLAAAQPTVVERAAPKDMITVSEHSVNFFFCLNIARCVKALEPVAEVCARAADHLGLDLLEDAACLAAAVRADVHVPSECLGCF